MIDPHWTVVDLDPRTWRQLGKFFDPGQYIRATRPGGHDLFVLHDDGRLLRVVDSRHGVRRDLAVQDCADPREVARRLFALEEWEHVHVINKRHLANVARVAQATPHRELTLDGYYQMVYHLLWDDAQGYVCEPPPPGHWQGWTYTQVKQWVNELPTSATLALGVFGEQTVEIGLVLELQGGLIKRVTTFEALDVAAATPRLSAKFLTQLWTQLEEQHAPPAGVLLCTLPTFEGWIAAADKLAYLQQAQQDGRALWQLRVSDDSTSRP